MFFRTADFKIKEFYDCSDIEQSNKFKSRIASICSTVAEKEHDSARMSIAIEPNYCYVITSGLHGDEANENGDFFRWSELLKKKDEGMYTFQTWIGKNCLENHNAKNIRGTILDSWAIKEEKSIDFLLRVDERLNPNLVKGIRNGSIKGTSMGVMVGHSYCSVCSNLAYDETQWCDHLSPYQLNIKGKKYNGQDGNLFPSKIGQLCFEDNRSLVGVEDSFITLGEPADPKALTRQVLAFKTKIKLSNFAN